MASSFDLIGALPPESPVVLSVPHAGREYPASLAEAARVSMQALTVLEDRYVDQVLLGALRNETALVQRTARAWIDLNRGEHDRDPRLDDGAPAGHLSAKVRSGLGLVPRRTIASGELWRRRLRGDEVTARIADAHRPYHAALAGALEAAHARFGVAILLDVHSMPPIAGSRTRIVVGDRFGRSAAARFVERVTGAVARAGYAQSLNVPYAGGYILERHACPRRQVHGIQLELDRALYLDDRLDRPGIGFDRVTALVRTIIDALEEEALDQPAALAAE
ncbi:N-formylglutamate amidohydrolase [Sphingomonas dokdonensis]|uniref:N-formylglutamate amidohydrolase n=1 Tax=Sphingomonas dokdonensis TaxID=344880 RepID=A0A245ZNL5_9SPHN|nr:N-formylglutamate amidohydrolase [Sphingomonas dokdonensis]OWK31344.1 N-formylglutamate amidohydrolase [Sphingomonas dokdonensis]